MFDWVDGENDHIIPRSEGGTNRSENLRRICIPCHEARHRVDHNFSILEAYPNSGHRPDKPWQLNYFYAIFRQEQPREEN
jgi:hypothetical protein